MKKLLGVLLIALAMVACNKLPEDAMIISGKVENAKKAKEIKVKGRNDFEKVIKLKEDGSFLDTLQPLKEGHYALIIGRRGFPVYFQTRDNLKIAVNLADKKAPITFLEGNSAGINTYITKKHDDDQRMLKELGGLRGVYSMKEDKFLETLDKIREASLKSLADAPNLPKEYIETEKKAATYDYLYSLFMYPEYYSYLSKNKEYKPSEKITKPLEKIEYNNAKDYENISMYRRLVMSHFDNKFYEEKADKKAVIKEIKNLGIPAFEKDFAKGLVEELGIADTDLNDKVALIKSLTSDKKVLKSLNDFLKDAATLAQGKASPLFTYKSINGKEVKLENLKGKLVYIDVWATWCGPCKGELPHLKKLEKTYHRKPIHFVSISVDKNKAAWEKMVKDKKLEGIQLHAGDAWDSEFIKSYKINGIPRFILLDKKGNIISADAPRPSSSKIKSLLNEWLKKK